MIVLKRKSILFRIVSVAVAFLLVANDFQQAAQAQDTPFLPHNNLLELSTPYSFPVLRGMRSYPDKPFDFDFMVDGGDQRGLDQAQTAVLIKYFLASLTIPQEDMWVNLSPYEKDRIIPNDLALTDAGNTLLLQDKLLKQLASSLSYPETSLGMKFWDEVYKKAYARFHTTDLPVNTYNKVWIVPDKAVVYDMGDSAVIGETHLKVMLEEDYLALKNHISPNKVIDLHTFTSQITKDIILPELEKEVNKGKNFAPVRQIFNSMILAAWFKRALRRNIISDVYVNQKKIAGIDDIDKDAKEKIYKQYLHYYKVGAYNYIREDIDPASKQLVPRKYFSGGLNFGALTQAMLTLQIPDLAALKRRFDLTQLAGHNMAMASVRFESIGSLKVSYAPSYAMLSPVGRKLVMHMALATGFLAAGGLAQGATITPSADGKSAHVKVDNTNLPAGIAWDTSGGILRQAGFKGPMWTKDGVYAKMKGGIEAQKINPDKLRFGQEFDLPLPQASAKAAAPAAVNTARPTVLPSGAIDLSAAPLSRPAVVPGSPVTETREKKEENSFLFIAAAQQGNAGGPTGAAPPPPTDQRKAVAVWPLQGTATAVLTPQQGYLNTNGLSGPVSDVHHDKHFFSKGKDTVFSFDDDAQDEDIGILEAETRMREKDYDYWKTRYDNHSASAYELNTAKAAWDDVKTRLNNAKEKKVHLDLVAPWDMYIPHWTVSDGDYLEAGNTGILYLNLNTFTFTLIMDMKEGKLLGINNFTVNLDGNPVKARVLNKHLNAGENSLRVEFEAVSSTPIRPEKPGHISLIIYSSSQLLASAGAGPPKGDEAMLSWRQFLLPMAAIISSSLNPLYAQAPKASSAPFGQGGVLVRIGHLDQNKRIFNSADCSSRGCTAVLNVSAGDTVDENTVVASIDTRGLDDEIRDINTQMATLEAKIRDLFKPRLTEEQWQKLVNYFDDEGLDYQVERDEVMKLLLEWLRLEKEGVRLQKQKARSQIEAGVKGIVVATAAAEGTAFHTDYRKQLLVIGPGVIDLGSTDDNAPTEERIFIPRSWGTNIGDHVPVELEDGKIIDGTIINEKEDPYEQGVDQNGRPYTVDRKDYYSVVIEIPSAGLVEGAGVMVRRPVGHKGQDKAMTRRAMAQLLFYGSWLATQQLKAQVLLNSTPPQEVTNASGTALNLDQLRTAIFGNDLVESDKFMAWLRKQVESKQFGALQIYLHLEAWKDAGNGRIQWLATPVASFRDFLIQSSGGSALNPVLAGIAAAFVLSGKLSDRLTHKIDKQIDLGLAEAEAAHLNWQIGRLQTGHQAEELLIDLFVAQQRLEHLQQMLNDVEEVIKRMQDRRAGGGTTVTDIEEAQQEPGKILLEIKEAKANAYALTVKLNALMGKADKGPYAFRTEEITEQKALQLIGLIENNFGFKVPQGQKGENGIVRLNNLMKNPSFVKKLLQLARARNSPLTPNALAIVRPKLAKGSGQYLTPAAVRSVLEESFPADFSRRQQRPLDDPISAHLPWDEFPSVDLIQSKQDAWRQRLFSENSPDLRWQLSRQGRRVMEKAWIMQKENENWVANLTSILSPNTKLNNSLVDLAPAIRTPEIGQGATEALQLEFPIVDRKKDIAERQLQLQEEQVEDNTRSAHLEIDDEFTEAYGTMISLADQIAEAEKISAVSAKFWQDLQGLPKPNFLKIIQARLGMDEDLKKEFEVKARFYKQQAILRKEGLLAPGESLVKDRALIAKKPSRRKFFGIAGGALAAAFGGAPQAQAQRGDDPTNYWIRTHGGRPGFNTNLSGLENALNSNADIRKRWDALNKFFEEGPSGKDFLYNVRQMITRGSSQGFTVQELLRYIVELRDVRFVVDVISEALAPENNNHALADLGFEALDDMFTMCPEVLQGLSSSFFTNDDPDLYARLSPEEADRIFVTFLLRMPDDSIGRERFLQSDYFGTDENMARVENGLRAYANAKEHQGEKGLERITALADTLHDMIIRKVASNPENFKEFLRSGEFNKEDLDGFLLGLLTPDDNVLTAVLYPTVKNWNGRYMEVTPSTSLANQEERINFLHHDLYAGAKTRADDLLAQYPAASGVPFYEFSSTVKLERLDYFKTLNPEEQIDYVKKLNNVCELARILRLHQGPAAGDATGEALASLMKDQQGIVLVLKAYIDGDGAFQQYIEKAYDWKPILKNRVNALADYLNTTDEDLTALKMRYAKAHEPFDEFFIVDPAGHRILIQSLKTMTDRHPKYPQYQWAADLRLAALPAIALHAANDDSTRKVIAGFDEQGRPVIKEESAKEQMAKVVASRIVPQYLSLKDVINHPIKQWTAQKRLRSVNEAAVLGNIRKMIDEQTDPVIINNYVQIQLHQAKDDAVKEMLRDFIEKRDEIAARIMVNNQILPTWTRKQKILLAAKAGGVPLMLGVAFFGTWVRDRIKHRRMREKMVERMAYLSGKIDVLQTVEVRTNFFSKEPGESGVGVMPPLEGKVQEEAGLKFIEWEQPLGIPNPQINHSREIINGWNTKSVSPQVAVDDLKELVETTTFRVNEETGERENGILPNMPYESKYMGSAPGRMQRALYFQLRILLYALYMFKERLQDVTLSAEQIEQIRAYVTILYNSNKYILPLTRLFDRRTNFQRVVTRMLPIYHALESWGLYWLARKVLHFELMKEDFLEKVDPIQDELFLRGKELLGLYTDREKIKRDGAKTLDDIIKYGGLLDAARPMHVEMEDKGGSWGGNWLREFVKVVQLFFEAVYNHNFLSFLFLFLSLYSYIRPNIVAKSEFCHNEASELNEIFYKNFMDMLDRKKAALGAPAAASAAQLSSVHRADVNPVPSAPSAIERPGGIDLNFQPQFIKRYSKEDSLQRPAADKAMGSADFKGFNFNIVRFRSQLTVNGAFQLMFN